MRTGVESKDHLELSFHAHSNSCKTTLTKSFNKPKICNKPNQKITISKIIISIVIFSDFHFHSRFKNEIYSKSERKKNRLFRIEWWLKTESAMYITLQQFTCKRSNKREQETRHKDGNSKYLKLKRPQYSMFIHHKAGTAVWSREKMLVNRDSNALSWDLRYRKTLSSTGRHPFRSIVTAEHKKTNEGPLFLDFIFATPVNRDSGEKKNPF